MLKIQQLEPVRSIPDTSHRRRATVPRLSARVLELIEPILMYVCIATTCTMPV
jgi:hypothetical protein